MEDLNGVQIVEIEIRTKGMSKQQIIHVNVDGVCRLRIQDIGYLQVKTNGYQRYHSKKKVQDESR